MGFMDELKDKAEEFGEKAKEGFGVAQDKAEDMIENVKDRFDDDAPADKASDAGDSSEVGYDAAEGKRGRGQHRRLSQISTRGPRRVAAGVG